MTRGKMKVQNKDILNIARINDILHKVRMSHSTNSALIFMPAYSIHIVQNASVRMRVHDPNR